MKDSKSFKNAIKKRTCVFFQNTGNDKDWYFYLKAIATVLSSYHPICLLDTMVKVLERIIYNRLKKYVDETRGFKKNKNIIDAMSKLVKIAAISGCCYRKILCSSNIRYKDRVISSEDSGIYIGNHFSQMTFETFMTFF